MEEKQTDLAHGILFDLAFESLRCFSFCNIIANLGNSFYAKCSIFFMAD